MLLLIWLLTLVASAVLYFRSQYRWFRRAQVHNLPVVAPLGNLYKTTLKLEHFSKTMDRLYHAFPEDRFVGHFEFVNHLLVIRDRELLRQITLKDFDHFVDHRILISENSDPLFGRNLFSLKGAEWRDMRATLSPAFTSSKIRLMVPFMVEVGNQMITNIKKNIEESGVGSTDVEVRDLSTRYTNDVIASCAFGLKVDSISDRDNEFYRKGYEATNFSFYQLMKFFLFASFPKIMEICRVSLFKEVTKDFFRKLVHGVMKDREVNNIVRPDMIQLLMEAKKGNLKHEEKSSKDDAGFATVEESDIGLRKVNKGWSDDDLVAQALLFFLAGFDTVASLMTFLMYEMALNQDYQEKLYKEIKEVDKKNNGNLDYKSIQEMVYMDMVVSETLRLWTPAVGVDRVCVKDYNLGKPHPKATKDYIIRKGEGLMIPIWSIHRDAEYFENPDTFNPERFSEENKHNIKPFTFIPFGLGPRNCIGSRFALCEVKVMVYQLLRSLRVLRCARTTVPPVLETNQFNLRLKGGHWVRFAVRED